MDFNIVLHDIGQLGGKLHCVQPIGVLGEGLVQSSDSAGEGPQIEGFLRWRLPRPEGHTTGKLQKDVCVEHVGLGALNAGFGKVSHGAWISDHGLNRRSLMKGQGGPQAVDTSRFQAGSSLPTVPGDTSAELLMAQGGIGEFATFDEPYRPLYADGRDRSPALGISWDQCSVDKIGSSFQDMVRKHN